MPVIFPGMHLVMGVDYNLRRTGYNRKKAAVAFYRKNK